jgi:UDP-GlcNAc:undecaprenyl-phosphate/decaprenyl-phosphate GlcNAc-1-phosphate transferase
VRLAGLAASFLVAALAAGPWVRDMWAAGLRRENWRGREVAFPAGAVLIACSLVTLAPLAIFDDRAGVDLLDPDLARWSVFVIGMALLGLIDDTMGGAGGLRAPRGWRGHARAVMHGKFSTGAVKAVGAIGLAAFATTGNRQDPHYFVDLVLLLLTTNLFNLIDLRPGRVEKAFVLLLAGICLGAWTVAPLDLLGVFIGPVLIGAALTLRERAMLGDTGSYLVGSIAGISLLVAVPFTGRLVALVVVAALTIFGEFRSISAAIERFPLLRSLDSLGRVK